MQAAAAIDLRAEAMSSWPMGWNKNEFQLKSVLTDSRGYLVRDNFNFVWSSVFIKEVFSYKKT
jgi:hypothetical protein